jgi:hypothetical protein
MLQFGMELPCGFDFRKIVIDILKAFQPQNGIVS